MQAGRATNSLTIKKWYTPGEAAAALAHLPGELVTERDVLDRVNAGELAAWFHACGHYAVPVFQGCHYYPTPEDNPLFPPAGNASAADLASFRCGGEDLLDGSGFVEVLNGRYRVADYPRNDAIVLPGPDARAASIHFAHGLLVCDDDGETLGLQAVESDRRDDGHWGDFQLRDPGSLAGTGSLTEDAVRLGFGFEAGPSEVISRCRSELEPVTDADNEPWGLDEVVTVNPLLLPLLAHPHYEAEKR